MSKKPPNYHGYQEKLTSPIYATGIGLLLQGFADIDAGKIRPATAKPVAEEVDTKEDAEVLDKEKATVDAGPNWFDNVFRKTKEWFEAEPDSDF